MALTCCMSPAEVEALTKSKEIDKQIQKDKAHHMREIKLLLLGAGESGKSTLLKQMKIIHGQKFTEEQVQEYRQIIYDNIIRGMKVLVDARLKLGVPWVNPGNEKHADFVKKQDTNASLEPSVFTQYILSYKELWQDGGIQSTFDRRGEYHLTDSVRYFFDEIDRIGQPDYVPTQQDILYARKKTRGIHEHYIDVNNVPFRFVDVGGQRSQRQKWFQCFDQVTSILFLASSNEFDQLLWEDNMTNRLIESCDIYENIVNHKCFINTSIILFLNKSDLLAEKIKRVNIKEYFPNFQGEPHNIDSVQTFIKNMFAARHKEGSKVLYHYFTTAVDTENIKKVFSAVKDTILQRNVDQLMLY